MGETPILLTGATGYIGGRLLRILEEDGRRVRCLARHPERVVARRDGTEVVAGDSLDEQSLDAAMEGVEQAFYLVHSMASGPSFAEHDGEAAGNLGRAARNAGVRRIIDLGVARRSQWEPAISANDTVHTPTPRGVSVRAGVTAARRQSVPRHRCR